MKELLAFDAALALLLQTPVPERVRRNDFACGFAQGRVLAQAD